MKGGGEDAHVAGEADEVDLRGAEMGEEGFVAGLRGRRGGDVVGWDAEVAGGLKAGGGGGVGEDYGDLGVGEATVGSFLDGPVDGEEV